MHTWLTVACACMQGGLGAAAAALLTALRQAGGIEAARSLYLALLPLPPPGGDFFRCLLQLEMEEAAATPGSISSAGAPGAPLPARRMQDLFAAATDAYGADDVQLWLLYCTWAARQGLGGEVGGVHWKASKELRRPEEFEAAYLARFKLHPTSAV